MQRQTLTCRGKFGIIKMSVLPRLMSRFSMVLINPHRVLVEFSR